MHEERERVAKGEIAKKRLEAERAKMQGDLRKKEQEAQAQEAEKLRNAEIAKMQAEEAARQLAAAKWRPGGKCVDTQTDPIKTDVVFVQPGDGPPTGIALERELMLQEEQMVIRARERGRQQELEKELERRLAVQQKTTTTLACQTPAEFLKASQQSLDDKELDEIMQNEQLARNVLKEWMRKAVQTIFLDDEYLAQIMERLDFDRKGPAPDLLRRLRERQLRNTALSKSVLKRFGEIVSREKIKQSFWRLKLNFHISRAEDTCQELEASAARRAERVRRLRLRIEEMEAAHARECHDYKVAQLREEVMSSSEQAKVYKSISQLIAQVQLFVQQSKENILRRKQVDGRPEQEDVLFEGSVGDGDGLKKSLDLASALGAQCQRWVQLVDHKLPVLTKQAERCRIDIGNMQRKRLPLADIRLSPTRSPSVRKQEMHASSSMPDLPHQGGRHQKQPRRRRQRSKDDSRSHSGVGGRKSERDNTRGRQGGGEVVNRRRAKLPALGIAGYTH